MLRGVAFGGEAVPHDRLHFVAVSSWGGYLYQPRGRAGKNVALLQGFRCTAGRFGAGAGGAGWGCGAMSGAYLVSEGQRDGGGEKRRAFELLETWREVYLCRARRALLRRLLDDGPATVETVRAVVPVPEGVNPNVCGAVPAPLARRGIIRRVGYAKARRPERHAGMMAVWAVVDRGRAGAWLREHPEPRDLARPETQGELFPETEETPTVAAAGETVKDSRNAQPKIL